MNRHYLPVLVSAMLAGLTQTGCVAVDSARFVGATSYPATHPAEVQLLRAFPSQPYEELGELFVEPGDGDWPEPKVAEALRQHGSRMGADAVVVVFDHIARAGYRWSDWDVQPYYGRAVRAVAIKLRQQPTAALSRPKERLSATVWRPVP